MNLGYVVACGYAIPVISVELARGMLIVTAERPGPLPASEGPVSVFGADGVLVGSGGSASWPRARRGDILRLPVEITFTGGWHQAVPGHALDASQPHEIGPAAVRALTAG